MGLCSWLIPIIGALIGWFTLKILLYFLRPRLEEKFDSFDMNEELGGVIDERMDGFIEGIKQDIPMAGLFLGNSLVENLKKRAKGEIFKSIPGLKLRLKERIAQECRKMGLMWKAQAAAACFGFSLGILLLLIDYLCKSL